MNGDFVFDFGENGTLGIHEEFFPNGGIEAVAIGLVVFGSGVDVSDVALMFESRDFEFMSVTNEAVEKEVLTAAFISVANDESESGYGHEVGTDNVFLTLFDGGDFGEVGDDTVGGSLDDDGFAVTIGGGFGINHGDIGLGFFMEVEKVLEVDVVDVGSVGEKNELLAGKFGEVKVGVDVFKVALARVVIGQSSGQISKTVAPASEIPIFTGADMVKNGAGEIGQEQTDGGDAGIDHIGESEIDEAIATCEGQSLDGASGGKFTNEGIAFLEIYNTDYLFQSH